MAYIYKCVYLNSNQINIMKRLFIYTSLFLFLGISACDKEGKVDEENRIEILDYLSDNNLTAQETDSGLFLYH